MVVIILYQGGGGSGLGLWISQEIVKLHGSRILVHSNGEGCGTRFVSDSFYPFLLYLVVFDWSNFIPGFSSSFPTTKQPKRHNE